MRILSPVVAAPLAASLLVTPLACEQQRAPESAPSVEYLTSAGTAEIGLPFSDAVRVGNMLYVSGQIGSVPGSGALVPGGIAAETQQALENIRSILERHGSSMQRVVKCTVMLADIGYWPEMNSVYVTFFPENLPARSAFGASGLALGARVEIECWATVGTD
jgi:2-iminobutanoate/2-iminopropanoate deaminase